MATILPNINASSTKMTTGERRFGQRLEKFFGGRLPLLV